MSYKPFFVGAKSADEYEKEKKEEGHKEDRGSKSESDSNKYKNNKDFTSTPG